MGRWDVKPQPARYLPMLRTCCRRPKTGTQYSIGTDTLPTRPPFWRHHKITITPHTSARTLRETSIAQIADKIEAVERGDPVSGTVDLGLGY